MPRRYWVASGHWLLSSYACKANISALSSYGVWRNPYKVLRFVSAVLLVALLGFGGTAFAHKSAKEARLPQIGPAPEFTLTGIDGNKLALGGPAWPSGGAHFYFHSLHRHLPDAYG